jgi:hypothetical protein
MVRSAIYNAGFRASQSHCDADALKTDAPPRVVWDILRQWVQNEHPVRAKEGSAAVRLLSKPITTNVDFTLSTEPPQTSKISKFIRNPENWGPKKAAAGGRFVAQHNTRALTASSGKRTQDLSSSSDARDDKRVSGLFLFIASIAILGFVGDISISLPISLNQLFEQARTSDEDNQAATSDQASESASGQ